MRVRSGLATLALVALHIAPAMAADIPPVPAEGGVGKFTHDYASVIGDRARRRIAEAQKRAFEEHDSPIIVVTIPSMASYDHRGPIESLAREWFDAWRIGTLDRPGGANTGVLVLVSIGDRKARIELGADWGRRWDAYCQSVMDDAMIPQFKRGDYGSGIASGVESLSEMAAIGPGGSPPSPGITKQLGNQVGRFSEFNGMPPPAIGGLLVLGVALVVLGIFAPRLGLDESTRKWLILGGLGIIVIAFIGWIALMIAGVFLKGGSGGGSSGGYSGGGFSGGSSGGGGASGSW